MKEKSLDKKMIGRILFAVILLVGVAVRVYRFGSLPRGINQDEAFGGYEAYSILKYGKDSFGYHNPVYLVVWGSGMSALNSYLMMPFIAIFGLKSWVIRLPQLIVAICSIIVSYLFGKKLFDEKFGLISMFMLAIMPWHIMLARWGLDCNLAPGFLLFGAYFFFIGLENNKYLIVSAVMYGLSLYCYATIWPIVPIIIIGEFIYGIIVKKIKFNKEMIISVVVFVVFALPLLLFLLVNKGYIKEIKTNIISIPKLLYMRSGEISFSNIKENFQNFFSIMTNQTDGLVTNVYGNMGFLYKITLPLFVIGLIIMLTKIIIGIKNKEIVAEWVIFVQYIAGQLLVLMINVNVNRANSIMIPIIFIAAYAVYRVVDVAGTKILACVVLVYGVMFLMFTNKYFKEYNEDAYVSAAYSYGLEDAMAAADKTGCDKVYITSSVSQARVMFYSKIPVDEYIDTVVYNNYPGAFVGTDSFGKFCMNFDVYGSVDENGAYVLDDYNAVDYLKNIGFEVEQFGNYYMAVKK